MSKIEQHIIDDWARVFAEKNDGTFEVKDAEDKNEFEVYKKTWKKLEEMQEIEQFDTDKAWNNLYSRIGEEKDKTETSKVKRLSFNSLLAIAASILIIIGIGGYLLSTQVNNVKHYNTELTAKLIDLPDGTQVYLNSQSELSYSKGFNEAELREVTLNGEAFFDVTRDEKRPFIIQAKYSFVKVLGTSFNVNTKPSDVEVVVKTGAVEVYTNNAEVEHVILIPGDKAILNAQTIVKQSTDAESNYLSWLNRKLVFKAMPLHEVIADLKNTYHCDIEVADTAIRNLKITSTFDNDPIDEVLQSIALALNLHIEKEAKKYTLVSN